MRCLIGVYYCGQTQPGLLPPVHFNPGQKLSSAGDYYNPQVCVHTATHTQNWVLPLFSAATDVQSQPGWSFLILCTEKKLLSQLRMRPAEWWGGGLIRSLPWGCDLLTFALLAKPGVAGLFRRTSRPADCNWSFHLLRLYKVDFCSPLRRGL